MSNAEPANLPEINIYFLHIPKCGGVSLKNALTSNLPECYTFGFGHRPYSEIQEAKTKFVFTFVRNPWDRILSLYSFWKGQDENHRHYKFDKAQADFIQKNGTTFHEFVRHVSEKHPLFMQKKHPHPYIGYFFPTPSCIDFIGKVETYQSDFDSLCDKINIKRRLLPVLNKSNHSAYTGYYDKATADIVASLYAEDIEYFGYKFGE